jgi:hypothetical protein
MDKLMDWLPAHMPASARDESDVSVVHGDYRLDNVMFHPTEPRAIAVLDWELSTLGHPLADFSYHCMSWHISTGGLPRHRRPRPQEPGHSDRERVHPPLLRAHRPHHARGAGARLEFLPGLQPVPHGRDPARHCQAGRGRHRIERTGRGFGRGARPMAEMAWQFAQKA